MFYLDGPSDVAQRRGRTDSGLHLHRGATGGRRGGAAVFSSTTPDGVPSPALTPGAVADDIDRALWRRLADADLLGLTLDPRHGGSGLDPLALC
ncbi:putative acyl-CoA dehydrogenase, partial [Streptomyces himastatinicus ATCC 53653]